MNDRNMVYMFLLFSLLVIIFILLVITRANAYLSDGAAPGPSETTLDEKDGEGVVALPSPEDVSPSGAAAWHIPVRVPPGRNGISPDLFLSYDGQGRAGIAGEGWNVEPGSVRRSMKRGVDYGAREFAVSGARGRSGVCPRATGR